MWQTTEYKAMVAAARLLDVVHVKTGTKIIIQVQFSGNMDPIIN